MIQHQISLAQAIEYTRRYRESPVIELSYSETYLGNSINALMAQDGCHSFRIYLGRKADNRIITVLVAVDKNGQDILPSNSPVLLTDDEGFILDDAFRCPPICPPFSPLNG